MQNKNDETLAHVACAPLGEEVTGQLRDILVAPEFKAELKGMALQEEAARARLPYDIETGKAASRAIAEIGCASCLLSDVCVIGGTLGQKAESGAAQESLMDTAVMLASAPRWLTAARINRTGIDGRSMLRQLKSPDEAERLHAAGKLPLETLVGGVKNHLVDEVSKKDVPVLAPMPKIDPRARLAVHEITTKAGTFRVIDASEAVGFKKDPLDPQAYGNLTSKLLGRMEEVDSMGKPHVFTADNTMQKVITKHDGATLFEVRMSGKSRMYFWVTQKRERTPEIVIVGSHGDDERTQEEFIMNNVRSWTDRS